MILSNLSSHRLGDEIKTQENGRVDAETLKKEPKACYLQAWCERNENNTE